MQNEHTFITYPTWKKYIIISYYVEQLRVRDKRHLFHIMRKASFLNHDTFFPNYGITAGEFAIWQILSESKKVRRKTQGEGDDDQSSQKQLSGVEGRPDL